MQRPTHPSNALVNPAFVNPAFVNTALVNTVLVVIALVVIALVVTALACQSGPAVGPRSAEVATPSAPDPIAPFEGRWIQRGPYNIIGVGQDVIWTIARGPQGWTIAQTLVHHPSVNERDGILTRQDFAPVALEWTEHAFSFADPRGSDVRHRITVERRDDVLWLPALVQHDERTWEFRTWHEGGLMQCEHDPLRVASGSATHPIPAWVGQPMSYRTIEVDSVYARGTRVPAVEFLQRTPQGEVVPCGQLVLERSPDPPWLRHVSGSVEYAGAHYSRLSDEDWQTIHALPPYTPRRPR